jgi:hypothetical protein
MERTFKTELETQGQAEGQTQGTQPEGQTQETAEQTQEQAEERLFTQEEVNEIVGERVKREKAKNKKENEQLRGELAEEGSEYKQIAEELKAEQLDLVKQIKLYEAGVDFDNMDELLPIIKGESEEEIEQLVKAIAPDIHQKYLRDGFKDKQKQETPFADPSGSRKRSVWNPFRK